MRVAYSERALRDLERILAFPDDEKAVGQAVDVITDGVEALSRHPYLGRPVRGLLRELVISFGRTGYVALYRVKLIRVEILAVRHQREAGYR